MAAAAAAMMDVLLCLLNASEELLRGLASRWELYRGLNGVWKMLSRTERVGKWKFESAKRAGAQMNESQLYAARR